MSENEPAKSDQNKGAQEHLLYIFTRTPLHVGAGSSVGAIDLPIQRERHSRHPIIPGSSIKGVLRYTAEAMAKLPDCKIRDMFGPDLSGSEEGREDARAGDIIFGEARPLAFPVRSAKGAFAYITCELALRRFARDSGRKSLQELQSVEDQTCLAGEKVTLTNKKPERVVLEEYAFESKGRFPQGWESAMKGLVLDSVWKEAPDRLVLLSNGDFAHFVGTATEMSQHIKIDPKTGAVASGALFNLEAVPAETLFFAPVHVVGRASNAENNRYMTDCATELEKLLTQFQVLQFGGNSTTGLGFCSVTLGKLNPAN